MPLTSLCHTLDRYLTLQTHKLWKGVKHTRSLDPFPFKKCNAPWVSTVIEADGTVTPCFFHEAIRNACSLNVSPKTNLNN
ncbi:MAG: SPASM domain-containing protein [Chitinophagaceae bacterium]